MFPAVAINVLIASPGDVDPERDAVEKSIAGWNVDRGRRSRIVLLPVRWESHAISQYGKGGAQPVLNSQIVDDCDVAIALFHSRIGTATEAARSGTVEEMERCAARGVPVHVLFSTADLSYRIDVKQLTLLREFQAELQKIALITEFSSLSELAVIVRRALEDDVHQLVHAEDAPGRRFFGNPRLASFADLDLVYVESSTVWPKHSRALPCDEGHPSCLRIENVGSVPAEGIQVKISPVGSGSPPIHRIAAPHSTRLEPEDSFCCPVHYTFGTAIKWTVEVSWTESGGATFSKNVSIVRGSALPG